MPVAAGADEVNVERDNGQKIRNRAEERVRGNLKASLGWIIAEGTANALYGLILTLLTAAILGPEDLGRGMLAMTVVLTVETFSALGLQDAVIRARSISTKWSDAAATLAITLSFVGFAACVALASPMAAIFDEPVLVQLIPLAAVVLITNALAAVPTALLIRKFRAEIIARRTVFSKVLGLIVFVVAGMTGFGPWAIIFGYLGTSFCALFVTWIFAKRWPRLNWDVSIARSIASFGALVGLETALWALTSRLFGLLIGRLHGVYVYGQFQFALKLVEDVTQLLQLFISRFALAYFSALARAEAHSGSALLRGVNLVCTISAPCLLGLAAVAPTAIPLLIGAEWKQSSLVLAVLAAGWSLAFPRTLIAPFLRVHGNQRALVVYAAVSGLFALAAGLATANLPIVYAAAGLAARQIISIPWSFALVWRTAQIPLAQQWKSIEAPFRNAIAMVGAVIGARILLSDVSAWISLVVQVSIGAAIYLAFSARDHAAALRVLCRKWRDDHMISTDQN